MTAPGTLSGKYPVVARIFDLMNRVSEDRLLIILKELLKEKFSDHIFKLVIDLPDEQQGLLLQQLGRSQRRRELPVDLGEEARRAGWLRLRVDGELVETEGLEALDKRKKHDVEAVIKFAGIINPPADNKRAYWINDNGETDPDSWLAEATKHEGSWWVDWIPWLAERAGQQVEPPPMGSEKYSPIIDAPGTYVLEK